MTEALQFLHKAVGVFFVIKDGFKIELSKLINDAGDIFV